MNHTEYFMLTKVIGIYRNYDETSKLVDAKFWEQLNNTFV